MEKEPLSLYELNALVRQALNESLPDTYWIQAELSDVRSNATGHCYLEFIQKDARGNNLIAKARGTIWANVYRMLKPYFEESTGQAFVSGIKVMVEVTVEFHELYGFSLTVVDIDPTYTLGDMARKRREILKQLEDEGVLTLNKELEMPMLAQRIAVISSSSAAGYGDFCRQLEENPYGFVFYPRLFPALMQGNQVEESVIAALNAVNDHRDDFDVVVIIRGGGATSDLSGFDTYLLAANCAQFPLPIITGIGHERDDTVLDSVAHTRVKTPTAAAQFLITHMHDAALSLEELAQTLISSVSVRMDKEHSRLSELTNRLPLVIKNRTIREGYLLEQLIQRINVGIARSLTNKQHRLMLLEQRVNDASPERLLKRGFSITLKDGKAVTDSAQLKAGDVITTRLAKGEVTSEVK
ncbi:Exodeoxyribonuclease VII large subunit [Bacteroides luti]|uniref:Exodeoxyribonuclease 7 large subunit n=1 Tax=Bacteroides luti TaxID=1297750 RepID=A0A1M5FM30_9BACE|nr:exodeoxyribonuclease VII large subunit [Bacteroides luti]SHF92546.1 Exodeoxyribonuclease VII large subunit [Bacteroides luti]